MTMKNKKTIFTAVVLAVLLAACIVVDMTLPTYHIAVTVIKKATVYALVAVSMNLLNGFTGLFSLGQAGFMLLGAYAYGVLTIPMAKKATVYQYFDGGALKFSVPEIFSGFMGETVGTVVGTWVGAAVVGTSLGAAVGRVPGSVVTGVSSVAAEVSAGAARVVSGGSSAFPRSINTMKPTRTASSRAMTTTRAIKTFLAIICHFPVNNQIWCRERSVPFPVLSWSGEERHTGRSLL